MLEVEILSLFPDYFSGPFDQSMVKQARKKGILSVRLVNIRDFTDDPHHRTDDRCYGGGPGMVMMAPPVAKAIRSVARPNSHVVYLSPQGSLLNAKKCRELATHEHLVLLCGHYEGVDERVLKSEVDEEISIGDYVLTNGCVAAIVVLDALVRFIPGVLGHEFAADEDSFENGILDCPHYTRPEVFEGAAVPEVLLGGNHRQIQEWRLAEALKKTQSVRPDLLARYLWEKEQQQTPSARKRKTETAVHLSRLTLGVQDLKRSIAFYRDQLGLRLVSEGEQAVTLAIGGLELTLMKGLEPSKMVLELQAKDAESFSWAMQQAKRFGSGRWILGGGQAVEAIEFTDPDGYLWYLKKPL